MYEDDTKAERPEKEGKELQAFAEARTIPIYLPGFPLQLIGTGVLLKAANHPVIVTAQHVVDRLPARPGVVRLGFLPARIEDLDGGGRRIKDSRVARTVARPLRGANHPIPPTGNVRDVALLGIGDKAASVLANDAGKSFLSIDDLILDPSESESDDFSFGYPGATMRDRVIFGSALMWGRLLVSRYPGYLHLQLQRGLGPEAPGMSGSGLWKVTGNRAQLAGIVARAPGGEMVIGQSMLAVRAAMVHELIAEAQSAPGGWSLAPPEITREPKKGG